MKLNNEYRFNLAPTVTTPRSKFLMHQNIRTTFNAGVLVPFYVDSDVMPGDTFKLSGTVVIRQSTPIYPTMDNSFADIFFFRVPYRLVWEHFKEFMGENTTGAWTQQTQYQIPQLSICKSGTSKGVAKGDSLNYMGIPIMSATTDGTTISALPLRAYQLTWNDWFRDENFVAPLYVYKGDATHNYNQDNANTWGIYNPNSTNEDSRLAPVYKYKDYFNACLPEPQKGDPVKIPIGTTAPVDVYGTGEGLRLLTQPSTGWRLAAAYDNDVDRNYLGLTSATGSVGDTITNSQMISGATNQAVYRIMGLSQNPADSGITGSVDLTQAVAATINAQRMAWAAQRILEQSARTGTRYTEIIRGFFGVTSPDARQQRPEYLGGKRVPISMNQVAQTSSTDNTSPQGNVAAYSLTVDSDQYFTTSCTEHSIILGLLCVRQEHSYDQGIARQWSRKDKLDFYWPQMAFLGEQAVLNKEIYATATSTDDQVFGYNERWAELRYKNNINTGAFSTQYAQSLDSWHYGDSYASLPVLSDTWRRETKAYIDRTLAVTSAVEDQYIMDSRWEIEATRPIPMYSIPGLVDHF